MYAHVYKKNRSGKFIRSTLLDPKNNVQALACFKAIDQNFAFPMNHRVFKLKYEIAKRSQVLDYVGKVDPHCN